MDERLKEVLDDILSGIKQAGDFVLEQAPMVVQEFIRWEIISNAIGGILLIVGTSLLTYLVIRKIEKGIKDNEIEEEIRVFYLFILLVLFPIFLGIEMSMDSVKAYVAPRVVVLEKFSNLLK